MARYFFFLIFLSACTNPSREKGEQTSDSAMVQPADKTLVEKDSLAPADAGTLRNQDTIRADSL